ncbi:protein sax-3 isoform X4 [Maylandia zebra]|uniref:protein sax-3 isoform X4 n=1 Tax=Maylandia zebra TaxID=106582 RepID=UPI00403C30A6
MFSCHVWFLLSGLIGCTGNSTAAIWFSVPENHHVCLPCGSSGSSDVIWTRQDQEVLVIRRGGYKTNKDCRRYRLMVNGDLCVQHLKESDHGRYRCNQQLVAELQVLTGRDYTVSAGRTLLLPCSGSSKPKQRWFQQREGERREAVLTKYRNGTVKPERGGGRLSFTNDALQIQDLQPEDAGEYVCNGLLQARVTVLAAHAETSSQPPSTSTPPSPAVVTAAAPTREDTELQPWTASSAPTEGEDLETPPLCGETIHYASLGRQNWRERPSRSPPEQSHHSVIYSSVVSRPAARAEHKL